MCTNCKDLNKECPKDSYPLQSIDRLVDEAFGFSILSFLDAYYKYNPHVQARRGENRIHDRHDKLLLVMPFELKNDKATYQKLMDKILSKLVGEELGGLCG